MTSTNHGPKYQRLSTKVDFGTFYGGVCLIKNKTHKEIEQDVRKRRPPKPPRTPKKRASLQNTYNIKVCKSTLQRLKPIISHMKKGGEKTHVRAQGQDLPPSLGILASFAIEWLCDILNPQDDTPLDRIDPTSLHRTLPPLPKIPVNRCPRCGWKFPTSQYDSEE